MDNQEKPAYYAIIPASVRYDTELKDKAKLLYGEITSLSGKTGQCYASNTYFAELYNVAAETISRLITDLENRGYIKRYIEYKEGTKEIEKRIIIPLDEKINTPPQKSQYPHDEKVKENNTSINNSSTSIYEYIEMNFSRGLTPIEYEMVSNWEDNELTRYAIKIAVLNNAYSMKYINTILNNFKMKNIRTVQEAQQEEEEYKNKKTKNTTRKQKEQPVPEWITDKPESEKMSEEELKELEAEWKELIKE